MTQPSEVLYASEQYQEWLTALKETSMLQTHNQAQAMMRAVMHALRKHMTPDDVLAFANQLPPLPRGIFIENWRPTENARELASADAFVREVADSLSPHHVPPRSIVADVFRVWSEKSPREKAERMRGLLPDALKALWPAQR